MLVTSLIVLNTVLLLGLIVLLATFKRGLPDLLQGALNDVGTQLSDIFEKPQVQRAMSVLGKQSGAVRADSALKERVAEKALGQNVLVKKALDYFGLSALEGIELMQDPTFGPIIRGFVEKGGQGLLKGLGRSGFGGDNNSGAPRGRGVPLMS